MTVVEPRLYQGVRDVPPSELLPRNDLLRKLTAVFERFGFAPLETPAMEYLDILVGKYGAEGEKLIYRVERKGDGDALALRYDLTVPLARMVAMNPQLPRPFKRYQIQPVWRADRPQPAQGRFREFYQCDVDTVGTASLVADAENVAVVHEGILALGLEQFRIKINNRKLLRGMVAYAGLPQSKDADVLRVVDKLDKIGMDEVRRELTAEGVPQEAVEKLVELMTITGAPAVVLDRAEAILKDEPSARTGIAELRELLGYAAASGVAPERLAVDLSLTRGLDYYTGPVYEVVLTTPDKFGSLGGGGRYDDLMTLFGQTPVPATGVSIGLTRVLAALLKYDLLQTRETPAIALVMRFPDTPIDAALGVAARLRRAGVPVEFFYEADRLKKQFAHAEKKGIPYAVLVGAAEAAAGQANVKHLGSGVQATLPFADLADYILQGKGAASA
jgi:histidyl-tRNA synthetase